MFTLIGTQWHNGFNGRTGLRYETLFDLLDRKGYAGEDWWRLFDDIRLLEAEAIKTMRS